MKIYKLRFSPIEVNTYIIDDEKGSCAIIDCGCYDESEFLELTGFLSEKGLKPVLLLNTHLHLDHSFGNRMLFDKYGLLTHAAPEEEGNRISAIDHAALFGLRMEEPPPVGKFISHGHRLEFGDTVIEALFVPGHTAGSLAYYIESEKVVFTGDALFAGSIGRSDLPGGNHDRLIRSISENLLSLPGETIVYAGHGNDTTIAQEKENNPYLN